MAIQTPSVRRKGVAVLKFFVDDDFHPRTQRTRESFKGYALIMKFLMRQRGLHRGARLKTNLS